MEQPDGWVEDYHYDALGQVTAIEDTDPSGKDMKQQNSKGRRCAKPDLPAAFGAVSPPVTADR